MSDLRRGLYHNNKAQSWNSGPCNSAAHDTVRNFHRTLPQYTPTPLVNLEDLAKELEVRAIYLKDESDRFGLPSFKILGASWGTLRAIISRLDLPLDSGLDAIKERLHGKTLTIFAATDGNHGRAVARMGHWLGLPVEIRVPVGIHASTIQLIQSEGANVTVSQGNYDDTILEAQQLSREKDGILVQDYAFGDYLEIPQWIVDGYSTMLMEIDEQLAGLHATHVFVPVGVGSFAQAVTSYFRRQGSTASVIAVEPDTAACLRHSLELGHLARIETVPTIMAGLDCGTVSTIAWSILEKGVRASISVSDYEAHNATVYLKSQGISAGPCGASTVAALRQLSSDDKIQLGIDSSSVIVLPCTEGARDYDTPLDVTIDDPVKLTQVLVQINSANPALGSVPGPGETVIARYIYAWLKHRGLEAHWIEPTKGRPSVVGVMRGSGGGKSLMLNGHIDTVTTMGYEDDPLSGRIADGKLYGRGAADMKCGVAAAMVALASSKRLGLRGDVIFTGVADEENLSIGTEDVLRAGWKADGAIVNEPTNLCVVNAHKGFIWLEVNIFGTAAHGSRADLGVDAIAKAGHFLAELDHYARRLEETRPDSYVGSPTVHASLIKGGEEASSYPAVCCITVERRTLPGETVQDVEKEIRTLLEEIEGRVLNFIFDVRVTASRSAFESPQDDTFCQLVYQEVGKVMGEPPSIGPVAYWTDCALLAEAGIPAVLWGPIGEGLHAKEESADVESIRIVANALTSIASRFCR